MSRKVQSLIEESVIAEVLSTALKGGGDFAEIFAEDRRATGAESTTAGRGPDIGA